jgi:uncharacterized protein
MSRYDKVYSYMTEKLEAEMPSRLSYHSLNHILDVLNAAITLAELEGLSEKETELLKVAVLFHDAGFIKTIRGHEEVGCAMAKEVLPPLGFTKEEIEAVSGMIMATKYPPAPKTLSEKIICDADLDYLGRDDFFEIGNKLFNELRSQGSLSSENEWNSLQVNFLTTHRYFTKASQQLRDEKKKIHLREVKKLVMASNEDL